MAKLSLPQNEKSNPISPQISAGRSEKGTRTINQDAIYSSSQGFHFADIEGKPNTILIKALNNLQIRNERLQVKEEDIEFTHKTIQDLIKSGKLNGLDIVCDGIGGRQDGELASSIATYALVKKATDFIKQGYTINTQFIQHIVDYANDVIIAYNKKNHSDMGTAFCLQITDKNDKMFVTSKGDTRVYLTNPSKKIARRITRDNSLVEVLLTKGYIKNPSEIFTHPRRNEISDYLGNQNPLNLRIVQLDLSPEELVVLCCDGVWGGINPQNSEGLLQNADKNFKDNPERLPLENALAISFGEMFINVNCGLVNLENTSPQELADYLTLPEVGKNSKDNTSAIVVARNKIAKNNEVRVRRSSGVIESDWIVKTYNPQNNMVEVEKEEVGQNGKIFILTKQVALSRLVEMNK